MIYHAKKFMQFGFHFRNNKTEFQGHNGSATTILETASIKLKIKVPIQFFLKVVASLQTNAKYLHLIWKTAPGSCR